MCQCRHGCVQRRSKIRGAELRGVYKPTCRPSAVCTAATISGVNLAHARRATSGDGSDRSYGGASVACQTWPTSSRRGRVMQFDRRDNTRDNDLRATPADTMSPSGRRPTPPASAGFQSVLRSTTRRRAACPGGPTLTRT